MHLWQAEAPHRHEHDTLAGPPHDEHVAPGWGTMPPLVLSPGCLVIFGLIPEAGVEAVLGEQRQVIVQPDVVGVQ